MVVPCSRPSASVRAALLSDMEIDYRQTRQQISPCVIVMKIGWLLAHSIIEIHLLTRASFSSPKYEHSFTKLGEVKSSKVKILQKCPHFAQ